MKANLLAAVSYFSVASWKQFSECVSYVRPTLEVQRGGEILGDLASSDTMR